MRLVVLFLLLTACRPQVKEEIVPVLVKEKVNLEELLKPCPVWAYQANTAEEVRRLIKQLQASLVRCNADKAKIREKLHL